MKSDGSQKWNPRWHFFRFFWQFIKIFLLDFKIDWLEFWADPSLKVIQRKNANSDKNCFGLSIESDFNILGNIFGTQKTVFFVGRWSEYR